MQNEGAPAIRIPWLTAEMPFPPVEMALSNGLLAAGADLSSTRLIKAYHQGIFPWYTYGEPILWWSPHPRTVLQCDQFKLSKSLAKTCRKIARQEQNQDAVIQIKTNTAFLQVITNCASIRKHKEGTWISNDIIRAYYDLHRLGYAHSIEVWHNNTLVGGLYGVQIGQFFFGESMFSKMTDASKIALYYLTQYLQHQLAIRYIDCQQETAHLLSLGAKNIDRSKFNALLQQYTPLSTPLWESGQLSAAGALISPST